MLLLLSAAFADRPAALIAITEPATTDPISLLIGYGPLGIFLILLATGTFRTKYEVQRLEKQIAELQADLSRERELIRAFQIQLTGHALPALAQSARVFEAIPTTRSDSEELRRALDEAAALAKQLQALTQGVTPHDNS